MTSRLPVTFARFVESERAGGVLLIACTLVAMVLANSPLAPLWLGLWQTTVGGLSLQLWVNDALMAVFFLLVGLELEREIYAGELSELRAALFPIVAAVGGMAAPALLHYVINMGTPMQPGAGIPMATDIAFALAVLALCGNVPPSLKVFLTALAVIDDLGAIAVIGLAYSGDVQFGYLLAAAAAFAALILLNRRHVVSLAPYLAGGVVLWYLLLRSGIHPTVGGVLLAFAIPFSPRRGGTYSPSARLEGILHRPVPLAILPLFALANAGVVIPEAWIEQLFASNSLGIWAGLVVGKPVGITLACMLAVASGICTLPDGLRWTHIAGAGMLAGIGFTMSIFIANLAFPGLPDVVNASKMAILAASLTAAVAGLGWLRLAVRRS